MTFAFHFVAFGHHPIGSLCSGARYSLGPKGLATHSLRYPLLSADAIQK